MNPLDWQQPFAVVWLALYGIVLCRAGATYALGRAARGGAGRFPRIRAMLASPTYLRTEERIGRWGAGVVALSFLTIGFQTLANLTAGSTRMPLVRYLPALALGGACWATIYSTIGFVGFRAAVLAYERWPVATIVGAVVLVLGGLLLALGRRRSRDSRSRAAIPAEAPTGHDTASLGDTPAAAAPGGDVPATEPQSTIHPTPVRFRQTPKGRS
ncbi:hypothetical protein [Brevibacterium samyangense]|uniref:Membrane protein DedA, SNARE-associated domain n=1 Tax=Brevibacterium samyangense TaxID=366888 RepID=A0ABN2T4I0_9MICO